MWENRGSGPWVAQGSEETSCFSLPVTSPMVFQKISKDIKDWAIVLYYQGFIPQDICNLLWILPRSLSRWRHNQEIYGSTLPPLAYMAGHPQILNGEQVLSICKQLNRVLKMYLDKI